MIRPNVSRVQFHIGTVLYTWRCTGCIHLFPVRHFLKFIFRRLLRTRESNVFQKKKKIEFCKFLYFRIIKNLIWSNRQNSSKSKLIVCITIVLTRFRKFGRRDGKRKRTNLFRLYPCVALLIFERPSWRYST